MYFVYILEVKGGYFYKGLTDNIERRLKEHFAGANRFTKRYSPLRLIHVELCATRQEARECEKFFKSGFGREIIKEIAKNLYISRGGGMADTKVSKTFE